MNTEAISLVTLLPWLAFAAPALLLAAAVGIGLTALRHAGEAPPLLIADRAEIWPGRLAVSSAAAGLLMLLLAALGVIATGHPLDLIAGHWFGRIALSLRLDAAGLGFALVVAAVGVVALRFSRLYLHREAGYHRFLAGMCLLLAAMWLIALGGNLALVFVGWELAGFVSWLLIGYAWTRPTAVDNARFALVCNRIGDAGFLVALAIAAVWLGDLGWATVNGARDPLTVRLLTLSLLLAALVKSGQWPFMSWIARALEGPTPSSAVFYGALMVHAGVFLLLRAAPLLDQVPEVRLLLGLLGLATAVQAHYIARVQSDIKSMLLFATLSQIGLMLVLIGLGAYGLATAFLLLHAIWRAYQFLLSPSVLELPAVYRRGAPPKTVFALAQQRFHIDALADSAVIQPLRRMASDARNLDERVIGPLAGAPSPLPPLLDAGSAEQDLIASPGIVGRALYALADRLQALEARLLLQLGETPLTRLLREAGESLSACERLLEQPRYLLAVVALTFMVVL